MDWTVPVKVTPANLTFVLLFACATCPFMAPYFYGLFRLLFGTLYPAYSSYKAVKTKNVKEYVKWMMYWIVFALFTCAETFTDVFLSFWFPFYYEIKIILVLWLLSPATRGSSILYRKFVHPQLTKREKEIDEYLAKAKEQGYHTVVQLGTRGFNYASQMLLQTALKSGGTLVNHLRRSYSLSDLEPQGVAGRSRLHRALPPYSDEDQSDQVDTGADDESYPLDDLSEAHSTTALNRGEDSEPELSDKRSAPMQHCPEPRKEPQDAKIPLLAECGQSS